MFEKMIKQIKQDRVTAHSLRGVKRWQFVWDYYKLPIGTALLAVLLTVYGVCSAAGRGKIALYAVLVNAQEGDKTIFSTLLENSGIDADEHTADITAGYTLALDGQSMSDGETMQVLAALFGVGDMDLYAADEKAFAIYAEKGAFENLGMLLPEDIKKKYSEDLYYGVSDSGERYICGVTLHPGSPLHAAGYYSADVIIGIAAQAEHLDTALQVICQLLQP